MATEVVERGMCEDRRERKGGSESESERERVRDMKRATEGSPE